MTLAEFGTWGLEQGSVANPEPNNKYKGQCVSLIQQYLYKVFEKPFKAYGNAKDWETNYPKDYFKKLSKSAKLQKGDVIIYGSNYGGGYGHIGLIDVNEKFYDQNGVKKLAIGYRDKPFIGYVCVLRPINQAKLGLNIDQDYEIGKTYTTQVNLKIRNSASAENISNWKKVKELTDDGKENATSREQNDNAVLKTGTKVSLLELKEESGNVWGRIPSGWIAFKYDGKIYVK